MRAAWDRRFAATPSLTLVAAVDQADLYVPFFERADAIARNPTAAIDMNEQGAFIERTIDAMLVKGAAAR